MYKASHKAEKLLAAHNKWKAKNMDKFKQSQQEFKERNPDAFVAYSKKWKETHPEKYKESYTKSNKEGYRRRYLSSKYNLTQSEYETMAELQDGKCAICYLEPKRILCIDHDHATNKVRGLLCDACNVALGGAKDNIQTLTNMILYLKKYEVKED